MDKLNEAATLIFQDLCIQFREHSKLHEWKPIDQEGVNILNVIDFLETHYTINK